MRLGGMVESGRVAHFAHMKFGERSRLLADHLTSALVLADSHHYPSALAVLRAALEHHLVDRLLFLANRYLQVYPVKKEDVAAEDRRLASLQAGPRPDIHRWFMREGKMNVIVRGLYSTGSPGRGATLSPYYFAMERYDPFTGRPHQQKELAVAFSPVSERRNWAAEASSVWQSLFVYGKLRRNLLLNHLLTERQALQLDVHYGFLSAYAHPASDSSYELIYGHNMPAPIGLPDHYSGELVLLYVITLALEELTSFARMTRRAPKAGLHDWAKVEAEMTAASAATDYFWFLRGSPQALDRINEVHVRLARRKLPWKAAPLDPLSLPVSRVRYYRNPLTRLVELHRGWREMTTGLGFASAFPRADALRRC